MGHCKFWMFIGRHSAVNSQSQRYYISLGFGVAVLDVGHHQMGSAVTLDQLHRLDHFDPLYQARFAPEPSTPRQEVRYRPGQLLPALAAHEAFPSALTFDPCDLVARDLDHGRRAPRWLTRKP